jgi:hypothetical protein
MNAACCFVKKPVPPSSKTGLFPLFRKGCVLAVFLLAGSLLFAGCDFVSKFLGGDDGSNDIPNGGAEEFPWQGEPVPTAGSLPSIKEKFGIQLDGAAGVTAAFQELSAFIKKGGLGVNCNVIRLGDWIDLEGGLEVSRYHRDGTTEADGGSSGNGEILLDGSEVSAKQTPLVRLIVVGINSFRSNGTYLKTENDSVDHVVFQFQNIPGVHRMNPKVNGQGHNTGGYAASEMREYLVPVIRENSEVAGSGNFLDGLEKAGVPEEVLWGPTRYVSTKGNGSNKDDVAKLNDLLWLPTQYEMTGGSADEIVNVETVGNQVWLKYYSNANVTTKSNTTSSASHWWLSSAHGSGDFRYINNSGYGAGIVAHFTYGVVPVFCVW